VTLVRLASRPEFVMPAVSWIVLGLIAGVSAHRVADNPCSRFLNRHGGHRRVDNSVGRDSTDNRRQFTQRETRVAPGCGRPRPLARVGSPLSDRRPDSPQGSHRMDAARCACPVAERFSPLMATPDTDARRDIRRSNRRLRLSRGTPTSEPARGSTPGSASSTRRPSWRSNRPTFTSYPSPGAAPT